MSTTDNTPHDDTPRDATLADDVFVDSTRVPAPATAQPTAALPVTPAPGPVTPAATAPVTAPGTASTTPAVVTAPADGPWLKGPAPFAIVLGILGLLVAAGVLLTELVDVTFPWADLGPWTVVAAGIVVVLVGAIGLRSSRRPQA